jgi:hypothetical protein
MRHAASTLPRGFCWNEVGLNIILKGKEETKGYSEHRIQRLRSFIPSPQLLHAENQKITKPKEERKVWSDRIFTRQGVLGKSVTGPLSYSFKSRPEPRVVKIRTFSWGVGARKREGAKQKNQLRWQKGSWKRTLGGKFQNWTGILGMKSLEA